MVRNTIIFLVGLIIFLIPVNFYPLRNWDEAWYGEIIKNMASGHHSLLVPFWQGQYYFDKPSLYFWLSLPVVNLFGIGEWQVRLVSVVASACSVLLVYLISQTLFSKMSLRGTKQSMKWTASHSFAVTENMIGIFSALIFVSLGQVYVRFSHGNLDALLLSLFLATYYFWLKGNKWIWLSGITLGLGFLVKGWTLGLFPLFVIILHSWFLNKRFVPKGLIYIIVYSIITSGWWYLLGSLQFGAPFYNWYLFTPAEGGLSLNHFSFEPFRYLARDLGVWWIIIALWMVSYRLWKGGKEIKKIVVFVLCALCFMFFLCFSQEPADWHNLPVYPLVAIVIGWGANILYKKWRKLFLVAYLLFLIAQTYVSYKIENLYPDRSRVGADLGKYAQQFIQSGEIVILDDHDFTSFLYYSNAGKVYVISPEGGKPGEFWTLKYVDMSKFVQEHPNTLLISQHPEVVKIGGQVITEYKGYKFVEYGK